MNLIVCIKQVPDTNEVKLDPLTNTLVRQGVASILNPFDTYAIEEAVRIKEKHGGKVTALTMGPPQAQQVLRDAIAVGADEGILLSDREFAGADTLATSTTLAQAIRKIGAFDLILCGKQAVDGDTAQVGPGIAALLDIPQIVFVKAIRELTPQKIVAERMTEEGFDVVESSLPCLVSVVKGINEPRLPSLRGVMTSKKAQIPTWTVKDVDADPARIGLKGSPTYVHKIFTPPPRTGGRRFEGEAAQIVDAFVQAVKDDKLFTA
jgi:electron transfer flavoprotein beta subunit